MMRFFSVEPSSAQLAANASLASEHAEWHAMMDAPKPHTHSSFPVGTKAARDAGRPLVLGKTAHHAGAHKH
jgi:hypothetical protein